MHKFLKVLLLGGLAGFGLGSTAGAATSEGTAPEMTVHYSLSSLTTDEGARALYRRLSRAAEMVCPNEPSNSRIANSAVLSCREQALSAAVAKIHNQRLAALYAASGKAG